MPPRRCYLKLGLDEMRWGGGGWSCSDGGGVVAVIGVWGVAVIWWEGMGCYSEWGGGGGVVI